MQEEKKHSKLKSVKTWLAIWAAANFSLLLWGVVFKGVQNATPLACGLLAIIAGYFGVNLAQKKIFKQDNEA